MKQQKLTIALAAALFLSLSVNFFFAGLMIGDAVAPGAHVAPPPFTGDSREHRRAEWQQREQALHAALSEEDRAVMKAMKEVYDAVFENLRADLDAARAKVAAAMEAEPLDQETLDDAIAAEAVAKSHLLQEMTEARRKTLEHLSPEGRALLRKMMPLRRGAADRHPMRDERDDASPPREGRRPLPPGSGNGHVPPDARGEFLPPGP